MTPATTQLVQDSWAQVRPIADVAGSLFHRHLFTADPALRPLLRGDIDAQAARLRQMIGVAVSRLDDLLGLLPVLQPLGRPHHRYGVPPANDDTVGCALLDTMAQGPGTAFTPEVRAAWIPLYGTMARASQDAATVPAQPAAT